MNSTSEEVHIPTPFGVIAGKFWNKSAKETPIIAVHGWLDNAGSFDGLIPLLDKKFPILAIDLPGHGLSSPRPVGFGSTILDQTISLDRVIRYFKWSTVILLGHSMGAGISFMYAAIRPEQVFKVILLDQVSPLITEPKDQPSKTSKMLDALFLQEAKLKTQPPKYTYEQIVKKVVDSMNGWVTEESAKTLLIRGSDKDGDGLYSFNYSPLEKVPSILSLTNDHLYRFALQVKCEILAIKALQGISLRRHSRMDAYHKVMQGLATKSKRNTLVGIDGRHHFHMNNPQPVADSINLYLTEQSQKEDTILTVDEFFPLGNDPKL